MNTEFSFRLGKMPTEIYGILQPSMVMKPGIIAVYLICFNHLKMTMRIFRMIQETDVFEPLKMPIQSQMCMKWWKEIVDWL
jgi:hypothetical protein